MEGYLLLNRRTFHYLTGGVALLVLADLIDYVVGMPFRSVTRWISLNGEASIPAWYSSLLLSLAGLVSLQCFDYAKRKTPDGQKAFLFLAALLFFMSCDEVARLHESMGAMVVRLFATYSGVPVMPHWVWIGGPVLVVVFLGFIWLVSRPLSLVAGSTKFLVLGFSLIFLGGVILEFVQLVFPIFRNVPWTKRAEILVEESFEMIGTISIAHALIIWRDKTRQSLRC
jgi:hypothetical protein